MSGIIDALRRCKHRLMCVIAPKAETASYYRTMFGKELDFKNPKSLNEKIQILKLGEYCDNEKVTICVDKYRSGSYLKEKGLEDIEPKMLADYERARDIDWDALPDSFVVKCNHGCGYNIICNDKSKLDIKDAVKKLDKWMKSDYWKEYCEVQYKKVKKRITVEEFLGDDIENYRFFCFNGVPKVIHVSTAVGDEKFIDFFDTNWQHMDVHRTDRGGRKDWQNIRKPAHLSQMIEIAAKLSEDFPFVRVDLYDLPDKVYFSELTFVPSGGFIHLEPESAIEEWGSWLDISRYL